MQQYAFPCDTANNVCKVEVPAPGLAVVFLTDAALQESQATATQTFATTVVTGATRNTATINPTSLFFSNGRGGQNFMGLGSTSPGTGTGTSGAMGLKASIILVGMSTVSAVLFAARSCRV